MSSLVLLILTCFTFYSAIDAIHSHDTHRMVLQQALTTFTHAVHTHKDTLPTCSPQQEQCITNGQNNLGCAASDGCQNCPNALAGYSCQPTTRCLSWTPPTAIIAYPVVNGYNQPTQYAVGGPNNCAVTADCFFNQQACMNMGQDVNGNPSQQQCSAFSLRPEYSQQECQFCVASVTDGVGSLTSSDCTYTPKAGCTDKSQQPPVTRSGTCPGGSKPAVFVATPPPATTPITATATTTTTKTTTPTTLPPKPITTSPPKPTTTTQTSSAVGTTTVPEAVRRVSSGMMPVVSIVSMVMTGVTAMLFA